MNDPTIRFHLLKDLSKKYPTTNSAKNRIVNEMSVCRGRARVDVAVINGSLHGYEIKSPEDTLVRLDNQLKIYFKCFDYISVVTTEKYIEKIYAQSPRSVGVSEIVTIGGSVRIIERRIALKNKKVDPVSILELLWKDELLKLIKMAGLNLRVNSKSKDFICNTIVEMANISDVQYYVRYLLKERKGWRSDL